MWIKIIIVFAFIGIIASLARAFTTWSTTRVTHA